MLDLSQTRVGTAEGGMKTYVLTFGDDGVRAIYADELVPLFDALGPRVTRRISEVEPDGDGWSAWIATTAHGAGGRASDPLSCELDGHAIRACPHAVKLGPFVTRAEALAAEIDFLIRHRL